MTWRIWKEIRRKAGIVAALTGVIGTFCLGPANASQDLSEKTRMGLQIALMQYIDQRTENGQFLHLDANAHALVGYYPANLHPKIIPYKDHYVLCADFRRKDGSKVEIDFLAVNNGNGVQVIQTLVGQRAAIKEIIKNR